MRVKKNLVLSVQGTDIHGVHKQIRTMCVVVKFYGRYSDQVEMSRKVLWGVILKWIKKH